MRVDIVRKVCEACPAAAIDGSCDTKGGPPDGFGAAGERQKLIDHLDDGCVFTATERGAMNERSAELILIEGEDGFCPAQVSRQDEPLLHPHKIARRRADFSSAAFEANKERIDALFGFEA